MEGNCDGVGTAEEETHLLSGPHVSRGTILTTKRYYDREVEVDRDSTEEKSVTNRQTHPGTKDVLLVKRRLQEVEDFERGHSLRHLLFSFLL